MSAASSVITRIAPSPTGFLHIGNVRRALDNWLFAKSHGGKFMLRSDDTDVSRSTRAFEDQMIKDLEWLGLTWDLFIRQSERVAIYHKAAEQLKDQGRLYPCFETPEELALKRKQAMSAKRPPLYDRAALKLSQSQITDYLKEGRPHHWRFHLNPGEISWNDLIHGRLGFQSEHLSDPILIRSDGVVLYTLASVVDDLEFQISHIIRGDDHITNTAIQLQLMEALRPSGTSIQFAHLPLFTTSTGSGLSKREGSLGIGQLRDSGIEPLTILSYLAHLGSRDPIEPFWDVQRLIEQFDLEKFSKAPPKFQIEEVSCLNKKILQGMNYHQAKERLLTLGLPTISEPLWNLIRDNISSLEDVRFWDTICYGKLPPVSFSESDLDFLKTAQDHFPKAPLQDTSWGEWTQQLKDITGRKGKELFGVLRQALTGQITGPEMKYLFPLIPYNLSVERLSQCHGL